MNTSLVHSAEGLIERVKEKYPDYKGKMATIEEMESLQNQLGITLPKDLIHLYTTVPIIDAEFGFQEYEKSLTLMEYRISYGAELKIY